MNYPRTLEYLYAQLPMFHRIGAAAYKADLGNTLALCSILGNPQESFRSVHIAGTNGKGSTSHIIASILQSAGYKTGLYTSPHLKDFRERIRVNGKKIPKSYVARFVTKNKKAFEPVNPSFFEYSAVMAFQYFSGQNVDIAVIETGMGGRLDSTNVVRPVLSIITNISRDHTAFLGSTLPAIAAEKAGIIKPGVPVIIGETQEEVAGVFLGKAKEKGAPIVFADQNYRIRHSGKRGRFFIDGVSGDSISGDSISGDGVSVRPLPCPLKGIYQYRNFITSYQAVQLLIESGFSIPGEAIRSGYKNVTRQTGLQGRWQVIARHPKTICDVGHNEAGIKYILEQLRQEKYDRLHWVFGLVNDKDAGSILKLLPQTAIFYFCKADIPRGLDAEELHRKASASGLTGKHYPSVKSALLAASGAAGTNDLIMVGGSTFVVAEVL